MKGWEQVQSSALARFDKPTLLSRSRRPLDTFWKRFWSLLPVCDRDCGWQQVNTVSAESDEDAVAASRDGFSLVVPSVDVATPCDRLWGNAANLNAPVLFPPLCHLPSHLWLLKYSRSLRLIAVFMKGTLLFTPKWCNQLRALLFLCVSPAVIHVIIMCTWVLLFTSEIRQKCYILDTFLVYFKKKIIIKICVILTPLAEFPAPHPPSHTQWPPPHQLEIINCRG